MSKAQPGATAWAPAPVLDPDEMHRHLAEHGVFDAADEFYRNLDAGADLGPVKTPAEVRAWLKGRCAD